MSLPVAQQRVLDGIADALRASEPRLAAMFAIFTRLTRNDGTPRREQLPARGVPGWIARRRLSRRVSRAGLASRASGPAGVAYRRAFIIATPLAIVIALVGICVAVPGHGTTSCGSQPAVVLPHGHALPRCPVQAGPAAGQPPVK